METGSESDTTQALALDGPPAGIGKGQFENLLGEVEGEGDGDGDGDGGRFSATGFGGSVHGGLLS